MTNCIDCKKCYYRSNSSRGIATCDYYLMTGQRRNCPPENCDKFIDKSTKPKRRFKHINLSEKNIYEHQYYIYS